MRSRVILGVLTLSVLSPGCALPVLAVHNVRVEMRENLDEQMAGIREWWHRNPVGPHDGPGVSVQELGPGQLADGSAAGMADGQVVLPPPTPARGSDKPQTGGR